MRNEFVTHAQALALNELGFNEPCFGRYYYKESYPMLNPKSEETELVFEFGQYLKQTEVTILAPTFSQAFRWFRTMHGLYVSILPKKLWPDNRVTGTQWYVEVCGGDGKDIGPAGIFSYKDAEKACLDRLIELTKKQSK